MRHQILVIALLIGCTLFGQNTGKISGTVTDPGKNNESIPLVNVTLKGTTLGTTTDENGFYNISAPAGNYNIEFHSVGYVSINENITITANEETVLNKA